MSERDNINEAMRRFRLEMATDYLAYRDAFAKMKTDPPGALTDLATAMAMGDVPAQRGDAERLLGKWDEVLSKFREIEATMMVSSMFVHKVLYWLDGRGYLHTHRHGEGS